MEYTVLASGSTGNCSVITADGTAVLLDAGISLRRISGMLRGLGLEIGDVAAVLVTHEHSDHVGALPMLSKYFHIPVYATPGICDALRRIYPAVAGDLRYIGPDGELSFGTLRVRAFATSHDAAESTGYRFDHEGRSMVYATDTGVVTGDTVLAARGCDLAVLEANHDVEMLRRGPYPYVLKQRILSDRGHLSNESCGAFAAQLVSNGTRRLILAHLSQENNAPSVARRTVEEAIREAGAAPGVDVALEVAPVLGPLGPFEV